ncbi:MAG: hypothetical protein ABRQ26_09330 [Syntrophomonadaceae bacterium]
MISGEKSSMPQLFCRWCQVEFTVPYEQSANFIVTGGSCTSCSNQFSMSNSTTTIRALVEAIDAPILVLQSDPRQVYTANQRACELFDKDISQIEGFRGGQVFNCIHSFTELGCGKDVNCEDCKIKGAIVDTFNTGNSFTNVKRTLDVKKAEKTAPYLLEISTEKIGNLALVRINKYQ